MHILSDQARLCCRDNIKISAPHALAAKLAATADPLEVFIARAEARACLWREGELDLHEAVDVLQAAAVQTGLVGALGQDAVQAIMAKAFAAVRADADADCHARCCC